MWYEAYITITYVMIQGAYFVHKTLFKRLASYVFLEV